ncbi:MAG: ABC transporter ATP-binding protein [Gemmatimonadetes bacterium]|nr:MAG: ABC transporter ATP-binding protein [Gemmatimonadota bacterium]
MGHKLKQLWRLMQGEEKRYWGAILALGFATVFVFMVPLVVRITIDSIIGDKPLDAPGWIVSAIHRVGGVEFLQHHLWVIALIMVVLTAGQGVFMYLKGRWSAEAAESMAKRLREQLYDHLQKLPFAYHSRAETGDLIQRCTSDVETIRRFFAVQFVEVGRALMMLALVLPIMLSLDVQMTLVAMAAVPVIIAFAVFFFIKVKAAFQLSDEAEGELSTVLQENLTGIRVVRAFARHDYEIDKFDAKNVDFRDKTYRLITLLALYWGLSDLICLSQIAAVLVAGAYFATQGTLTLGTVVVFVTYEGMLLWPIRHMGRVLTDMGKALVSIGRIQEILDEPQEDMLQGYPPEGHDTLKGELVFDRLSFGYTPDLPVLKEVSFRIQPGQTVAIMGPTGAGKSTLVNLIPRLYDYQQGSIRLDGRELNTYDRHWLRQQIAIVLQEPFLYSKTIRDNIRLSRKSAPDREVYDAASVASIHDVILDFEKGYDTAVGERGVTLSGGQKQRIAIARAILQNAPILIFDDSLSAVDTETEAKIQRALAQRAGRATTIIIAHRLTTVKHADLILVLEDGRVTQIGNHDQLMRQDGLYRRIWNIQHALEQDIADEIGESNEFYPVDDDSRIDEPVLTRS